MSWRHWLLSSKQIAKIESHFDYRGVKLDKEHLKNVINFWHDQVTALSDHDPNTKPTQHSEQINKILLKHKDLLMIDIPAMQKRIQDLDNLGFVYARSFTKIFNEAPMGWFLQDWGEFSKKFGFFQYRILRWVLREEKDPWPDPHPLSHHPQIMEKSYEELKTRLTFVKSIGLSPQDIDGGQTLHIEHVLAKMLLTETPEFLARFAPSIREEEYNYLEELIAENEDKEDKLLNELVDLTNDHTSYFVDEKGLYPQQVKKKYGGGYNRSKYARSAST